jgi:hypothetical protein
MLKVTEGTTEIEGTLTTLLAELSTMVHAMVECTSKALGGREKAVDMILDACNEGTKTEEEIDADIEEIKAEKRKSIVSEFLTMLRDELEKGAREDG